MIVATYTYQPTNGTRQMARSVARLGYELAPLTTSMSPDNINAQLLALYRRAVKVHDQFIYSDAADTFFQCRVKEIPRDYILYSTEKACYPYPDWQHKFPVCRSPWRFLNGGGVCGPTQLMIEYYDRYKLCNVGSNNGQAYLQQVFFQALKDGFPVKLDTECQIFQTIAFADPTEFEWGEDRLLHNLVTGTTPAILHGNGLTEMKHIYERFV